METEVIDGWIVDTTSGEIIGRADVDEAFHADDEQKVEWVLEKLQDTEADIQREKWLLAARKAAIEARIAGLQRRADWLNWRFGPELQQWAKVQLEGKKKRSLQLTFGKLAFRVGQPKIAIAPEVEMERVISYCEENIPEAVKVVKTFLVSGLKGHEADLPAGLFVQIPATDNFSIDLGLKGNTNEESA